MRMEDPGRGLQLERGRGSGARASEAGGQSFHDHVVLVVLGGRAAPVQERGFLLSQRGAGEPDARGASGDKGGGEGQQQRG